ncbi:MAG: FRG domain-containing protein [Chitinophagaceae bacterium]|nr:FRG domain-containing protein [Chitinophagaceae bacterium]
MSSEGIDDHNLYFLQQHYGLPTRLLDWSTNPLAALFFAITSNDKGDNEDGELYIMDAYGLAGTQRKDINLNVRNFQGIATSRNFLFRRALTPILQWKREDKVPDYPKFIFPVLPDFFDRRIGYQKGCFTFHVPENTTLTKTHNSTLKIYPIPKEAKKDIRTQLTLLSIDDFNIFGDLESLARTLKSN